MEESLAVVAEASTEFVGRWNRLVSTTNWEKGRIICQWRQALEEAGVAADSYTDDTWARQVGGVTPQHVGRLRRVFERFGQVHDDYSGLYWSHFQVAVEWDDAEMWLEGAVQGRWSVARMCDKRWETLGSPPESRPQESDIVASEMDEDLASTGNDPSASLGGSLSEVHGEADAYFDDDDDMATHGGKATGPNDASDSMADAAAAEPVRPFGAMPLLPSDMNEAFELFKLAILNHKVSGWREIARSEVLQVLESLKQLAMAPAE